MMLETSRLWLREFTPEDTGFILALLNSPDWLLNIGDRNVRTPEAARQYLQQRVIPEYARYGYGAYLVVRKSDGAPMGMCGIYNRPGLDHPDIGFAFLPEYTRQGYARESASFLLHYVLDNFHPSGIQAFTLPSNLPCRRLLEAIGLRPVGPMFLPGDPDELILYEYAAPDNEPG